jgi:hypothetical protein
VFLGVPHEKIRLSELDDNGHPILSWCERVSENDRKGFCRVCRKQFEISQHGPLILMIIVRTFLGACFLIEQK